MSDFDDFDLGRRLRAAAGSEPDVSAARATLQGRVRRARRRRAVGTSAAAALVLLSAGTVAAIATRGGDERIETAATEPTTDLSTTSVITTDLPTSSTVPTSVAPSLVPTTVASGSTVAVSPPSTAPHGTPIQPPGSNSTTTVATAPGVDSTSPVPTSTSTPTTTPTTAPPAPVQETFFSVGGSITVRLANGSLSLVGSPSPAAGYEVNIEKQDPDEVEVRFESSDTHVTIRVRLIAGQMVRDDPGDESGDGAGDHGEIDDH
ncbi:MAG: hypothetical protein HZB15_13700 [Actinobacteria bacterium]|nr:hypothetical protein [Actinomycetota bacterium]